MTAKRAMQAAQRLYENGYITYMRTDSISLSAQAIQAARELVTREYGAEYLPSTPRTWTGKSRNAQEAHEAIRPAGRSLPFSRRKSRVKSAATKARRTSSSGSARSRRRWSMRA
jgi:DNA topoisomerase IA